MFYELSKQKKHTITPNDQFINTTDDCMLPQAMLNRCVRGVYNFQRKKMEGMAGVGVGGGTAALS